MGYMRHHAIVVTGGDWGALNIVSAHAEIQAIGDTYERGALVSPLGPPTTNAYRSFMVGPDGSKEGWTESHIGDALRRETIQYLDGFR
jgi:hypothetical protein